MADLHQKDVRTINEHLQNLYEEGELEPGATVRKFRTVRREGARGRWVVETRFRRQPWSVIVEPDRSLELLVIVTAFPGQVE